ncbi:MAG: type II toxin-antitoxin system VapC family toxin [Nitrososphaera sp.]
MSTLPLTYIDSNIFISYVLGPVKDPRQFPLAEKFFKGLAGDQYRGIISYLASSEILEVFRTIKGREFSHLFGLSSDEERVRYVIEEAKALYQLVIAETLKIPEISWMPPLQADVTELLWSVVEVLSRVRGSVMSHRSCKKCGTSGTQDFFSGHKCVGTADVIHALLAKTLKCDQIATFDKAFKELIGDPALKGLRIWVLE